MTGRQSASQLLLPKMPYLTGRALHGLREYKYQSAGLTWLDDLHQPFWNWCVNYLPTWLAPNLITLVGTAGLMLTYIISASYLPEFQGVAPAWVYFLKGLAVLVYMHLDCLDGKQARRTKSSSPLGQLFDHGCDALTVHLVTSQVAATLAVGPGPLLVVGTLAIMIPWIAAQWEEWHTGLMLYGTGYWGVLEANYCLVIVHWITAAVGPWLWASRVRDLLKVAPPEWLPSAIANATANEVVITSVMLFGLQQLSGQVYRVFKFTRNMIPIDGRGHKRLGRRVAAAHILQLGLMFALGAVLMSQPTSAPGQLRAVYACFGIHYALQATSLIMAHMCKEPFQIFWWPVTLSVLVIANERLQLLDPVTVSWAATGIFLGGYLHYIVSVINQICEFLNIKCLTISPPLPASAAEAKSS